MKLDKHRMSELHTLQYRTPDIIASQNRYDPILTVYDLELCVYSPLFYFIQDDLLSKALAVCSSASASSASSSSSSSSGLGARKGRPALNIGQVKQTNATPEAAQQDEQESQADALLKAKRMRNLKRQSMPEKLPAEVQAQVEHQ
jgi:hypothetical protein